MGKDIGVCELCNIEEKLTKHHLIPVSRTRNKYKDIKDDPSNWLWICRSCHDQLHALFTETQLRDNYNTKEKILESYEMMKFITWKRKHPDFKGHSKMSNSKRR